MKKANIVAVGIVAVAFAVGAYLYPQMPQPMASHWNFRGEVDGTMSKFWGLFLMPVISAVMLVLFWLIPKIDPLKQNIAKFRKYYDGFILLLVVFMAYLYGLTIAWNLGVEYDMVRFLIPAFAALFFYVGVLVGHAEPNWFIGIRTPWTLSNADVWRATHQRGAILFKAAAVISLLGLIFRDYAFVIMLAPVIYAALDTVVYSYLQFKKMTMRSGSNDLT